MKFNGFHWQTRDGVSILVPDFFAAVGVVGGYSTRRSDDGRDLDFDLRGDKPADMVVENRQLVCSAMGIDSKMLVIGEQVHGARVAVVGPDEASGKAASAADTIAGTDALVTQTPGVALCCLAADCPVILLADHEARVVAAAHSGWRGTAAGIARAAVEAMASLGSQAKRLWAAIGPPIGPCCYEVGEEVRDALGSWPAAEKFFVRREGRLFFDLAAALRGQLLDCGLRGERILAAPLCTSCWNDLFYSYRREGRAAGRTAGVIAIAP